MQKYKIVASDLDGTLLDSLGRVSAENDAAISSISARGAYFVPTTGRGIVEIPSEIKNHPAVRYIIHSSGAVLYDKQTGERSTFCMPYELMQKVSAAILRYDCHVTLRAGGRVVSGRELMNASSYEYFQVWDVHYEILEECAEKIDGIREKLKDIEEIEMISLFFHNDDDIASLTADLNAIGGMSLASACPHNLEITYEKASKGNALLLLSEKLGISEKETIAVGDSGNDATMVKVAGLGLAVSNSADTLKKIADEIVCSNDEHVIKYILEKYF